MESYTVVYRGTEHYAFPSVCGTVDPEYNYSRNPHPFGRYGPLTTHIKSRLRHCNYIM